MADNRFSALANDPRYRLPNRKEARTAVDPRFKRLFTDQEFRKKASVDRYGRKVESGAGKQELARLYRLDKAEKAPEATVRDVAGSSEDSSEAEDNETPGIRDPAREGGFSGSSSEEEASSEEESDEEVELAEETAGQEQTEDIPLGEVTRRIAVVNLDWDHLRAADIMAVANSFLPQAGKIESVTIYPSEFGRERMEREEIEGPPRDIFASSKNVNRNRRVDEDKDEDEDEDDDDVELEDEDDYSSEDDEKIKKRLLQDQTEDGAEFDTGKLRQYQLERLRYYYAVICCNSNSASKALYDAMDGREYLSTSNFFDLRFIPDDTSFDDDEPHDECTQLPSGYKPNEFRTEALTHSKVRLTWDEDDATRKEVQRRAFSRAEMDENDLQAYIGSDSSDAESIASRKSAAKDRKRTKKEAEREKMRAALGLSGNSVKPSKRDKDEVVGDMQITFTSGLGGGKEGKGVFENGPRNDESTRQKYIRKERERKQRRKDKAQVTQTEDGSDGGQSRDIGAPVVNGGSDEQEDPFNDPFFNDPAAASKAEKVAKKAAKLAKRSAADANDASARARRAELELLMAEDAADNVRHFDMREIEKAEKQARRKGKKGKKRQDEETVKDNFKVETQDPRFQALFESHEYAIDPTNPRFKSTDNMKALLEEGRKKRKVGANDVAPQGDTKVKRMKNDDGDAELNGLVARLKKKKTKAHS